MGGINIRLHRRFSPSQRERNALCPGSPRMIEKAPARVDNPYAIEGEKAHKVLEAGLRNGARRAVQAHREFSELKDEKLDDGNNSFYLSIQIALNYVYAILDEYPDAVLSIESELRVPLEAAPGEGDGYCDIFIYVPSIRHCWTIDYKHGAGVTKDIVDNKQVRQYTVGALYGEEPLVNVDDIDAVTEVIIQPRAFHKNGHTREQTVLPYEVYLSIEEINNEVLACLDPAAPLVPGEEQCRFCDARTICPAREAMGLQVANTQFKQIMDVKQLDIPAPQSLDVHRLGYIYNAAPLLRKFLDDVEQHIYELNRAGVYVPGTKLVEVDAKRQWYGDHNEIAFKLAALTGEPVTDMFAIKLVNITVAEKMVVEAFKKRVGRGKKKQAAEDAKQAFAFLTTKQSSGNVTLTREDDPKPGVNTAARSFAQIGYIPPPPSMAENQNTEDRNTEDDNDNYA